ncbi:hypothetical protein [Paracidovorax valerianellae]|uniref:Uncharacterized protein n=1 Tax=Paracidovorax valerianellae TaxID=187868 RepID=A0A1G7CU27_9BURK|nr:hypothetical protein [Paracidovorax valerianellae]MDA8446288.1 hypothetical protein [Paracidovorax valerianellae]SDE42789.1 hypothetical protein SAMN05192589_11742 [Paracidovorax valerianellae]
MRDASAGVAAEMLTPLFYERFSQLFSVAARKSLLEWREVATADAQVLLVDDASKAQPGCQAPCLVCVGGSFPEKAPQAQWVARLQSGYTVADLIDVLDRAAVFLMDWRARQKMSGAAAEAAAMTARIDFSAPHQRFQLSTWVSLAAPFRSAGSMRALALLTRAPVSLAQLCEHSGLDPALAQALLAELSRRGVLRTEAVAPSATPVPDRPRPVQTGLVQRLTRWVRGGGQA